MVQDQLGGVLGELGRTLVVAYQVPGALRRLCAQSAGMLPVTGCWAVLLDELDGRLRMVAATDAVAWHIEALHTELDEGPCLEAARTGERVLLGDLADPAATERFPRFAPRARAVGVAAVYCFPLRTADQHVGSLSLYNDVHADLDEVDLEMAQVLVDLTTASIVGARRYQEATEHLTTGWRHLTDMGVLEQAKGRLSVQLRIPPEAALVHLRDWAVRKRMPLETVAEQVASGALRLPPSIDAAPGTPLRP